ncbi:MAG: DUF4142 domain-containing protein [Chryseolinea sp.]
MKKINILIFFVSISLMMSCGKKTETDSKEISEDQNEEKFDSTNIEGDTDFAIKAADGSLLEVKLGELAQTNGTSEEVKKFGQQMIKDHTQAGTELKELAASKIISIPSTLSEESQNKYDDFAKMKGTDFDKDYSKFMVKDHKEDIEVFEKEASKGNDVELKSWAADKVPTLKHHLMMAEEAEKSVNK